MSAPRWSRRCCRRNSNRARMTGPYFRRLAVSRHRHPLRLPRASAVFCWMLRSPRCPRCHCDVLPRGAPKSRCCAPFGPCGVLRGGGKTLTRISEIWTDHRCLSRPRFCSAWLMPMTSCRVLRPGPLHLYRLRMWWKVVASRGGGDEGGTNVSSFVAEKCWWKAEFYDMTSENPTALNTSTRRISQVSMSQSRPAQPSSAQSPA